MKPLNLPKESQEALLNDASMFLLPIPKEYQNNKLMDKFWTKGALIAGNPYQIGDEVYIKKINIENGKLICPVCGFL